MLGIHLTPLVIKQTKSLKLLQRSGYTQTRVGGRQETIIKTTAHQKFWRAILSVKKWIKKSLSTGLWIWLSLALYYETEELPSKNLLSWACAQVAWDSNFYYMIDLWEPLAIEINKIMVHTLVSLDTRKKQAKTSFQIQTLKSGYSISPCLMHSRSLVHDPKTTYKKFNERERQ